MFAAYFPPQTHTFSHSDGAVGDIVQYCGDIGLILGIIGAVLGNIGVIWGDFGDIG
jgi:hypothetical protein